MIYFFRFIEFSDYEIVDRLGNHSGKCNRDAIVQPNDRRGGIGRIQPGREMTNYAMNRGGRVEFAVKVIATHLRKIYCPAKSRGCVRSVFC